MDLISITNDIAAQIDWIEHCGGSRGGYVEHYAKYYANGVEQAERIYQADIEALADLIANRAGLVEKERKNQEKLEATFALYRS